MKRVSLLVLITFFLSACKKPKPEEPQVIEPVVSSELVLRTVFGNQNFYQDSVYVRSNGDRMKILDLKFYLGSTKINGVEKSGTALYKWSGVETALWLVNSSLNNGELAFDFGLNASVNHSDPTVYEEASPLNILNADDMHWSWSSGYIFLKIEGKVDRTNDGIDNFDENFSYHVSRDSFFQTINLGNLIWNNLSESKKIAKIQLDVKEIFDAVGNEINFDTELVSHSSNLDMEIVIKVLDNFITGLTIE
jgi:hypothetical protein